MQCVLSQILELATRKPSFGLSKFEKDIHINDILHPVAFSQTLSRPVKARSVYREFGTSEPAGYIMHHDTLILWIWSRMPRNSAANIECLVFKSDRQGKRAGQRAMPTKTAPESWKLLQNVTYTPEVWHNVRFPRQRVATWLSRQCNRSKMASDTSIWRRSLYLNLSLAILNGERFVFRRVSMLKSSLFEQYRCQ